MREDWGIQSVCVCENSQEENLERDLGHSECVCVSE